MDEIKLFNPNNNNNNDDDDSQNYEYNRINEDSIHDNNTNNSEKTIEIHEQEQKPKKKKRLYWADCLRIFSILNIIFLHSANFGYESKLVNNNDSQWIYVCIYNSLTRFGVPMFVQLSGMFFLNPDKPFTFSKLLKRNILRLFTAFYFWSTVNAIMHLIEAKNETLSEMIKKFIANFFVGEEYLWFILMITGCYLVAPFLRFFSNDIILSRYFLGLWFVWTIIIPTIKDIINKPSLELLHTSFTTWTDRWRYGFVHEFVGYFAAGYYIYKHVNIQSFKKRLCIYIIGILNCIILVSLTVYSENKSRKYSRQYRDNMSIFIAIYTSILFIFFKHEIGKINFSERAIKIITKISSLTFGMYLSHMVIKNIILKFDIDQDHIGSIHYSPIIGCPLIFILISAISLLISYIISFIPVLKRYII